jgi:hypothetical protein
VLADPTRLPSVSVREGLDRDLQSAGPLDTLRSFDDAITACEARHEEKA